MAKGTLYLIPTILSPNTAGTIPDQVKEVIRSTEYFLVENERTARRYISHLKLGITIEQLHLAVLDKATPDEKINLLLAPLAQGKDVGIISESGCPGVADPGSRAVAVAHSKNYPVVPLSGPSSILLALMGSGFNGQKFCFHGYLPIDKKKLDQQLKKLEKESRERDQTQLFIETPYRNNQLLAAIIKVCNPHTMLSIARDVTGQQEMVKTKSIKDWAAEKPELHKIPTVFALYSGGMAFNN